MVADYQSLISSVSDYAASGNVSGVRLLKLALLKKIATNSNPMAATDYQSLLNNTNVGGYAAVSSAAVSDLLELSLLNIIAGGGGGGGVTTGTGAPTSSATDGALYLNLTDNTLWIYNSGWKKLV
jgi:hypothetical protein